nr:MAG TPA: hypothetical protein [Caudoviricetes sp.]
MGLYLKDKKVSPAIIQKENIVKLNPPIQVIDWDSDTLYTVPNPGIVLPSYKLETNINDELDTKICNTYGTQSTIGKYTFEFNQFVGGSVLKTDLSTLNSGVYNIKGKQIPIASTYTDSVGKFNSLEFNVLNEFGESNYSAPVRYERWNYTNNTTDIKLEGSTSGILNSHKYDEGLLYTYNKSINYDFNLNPSGKGVDYSNTVSYSIINCEKSVNSLICNGYYSGSSFAKISFTLNADTDIKVKYQITKSADSSCLILICPIDTDYTSFSYNSKLSNPAVSFGTTTDFEEKEFSFGTLSAGEHYYFIQFFCGSHYRRNDWNATITPVFEEISTGKYLPADITVVNDNNPNPEYEYDPYTGKFKISMTGNITMSAAASNNEVLTKFLITPSTWDVNTSILSWKPYTLLGIVYHIQTPDGKEYTTTETSFNLSGKLGEPSIEYKTVKLWVSYEGQLSGKTTLKLTYNPGYNTINNIVIDYSLGITNSIDYIFLETDDYYFAVYASRMYKIDKKTKDVNALDSSISVPNVAFNIYPYKDKYYAITVNPGSRYCYVYDKDFATFKNYYIGSPNGNCYNLNIFGTDYIVFQHWGSQKISFYSFLTNTYKEKLLPMANSYSYNFQRNFIFVKDDILYIICKNTENKVTILEINYTDIADSLTNTDDINVYNEHTSNIINNSSINCAPYIFDDLIIFDGGTFNIKTKEFSTDKYSFTAAFTGFVRSLGNNRYIEQTSKNNFLSYYLDKTKKEVKSDTISNYNISSNIYNGRIVCTESNKSQYNFKYFIP